MSFDFSTGRFTGRNPGRIALQELGRNVTYAQLKEMVEARTLDLRSHDRRIPIVIQGKKSIETVAQMLACASCGIPYVPVPADCPPARLDKIREIISGGGTAEGVLYIIFTSGSTGEPKGVQVTRANAADYIKWLTSSDFSFSSEDIFANPSAFSFDLSVFDFLLSLHLGATLILSDAQDFKAPGFFAKLGSLKPSVLTCTPSMLAQCLVSHDFDPAILPSLKDIYLCGETLPPETVSRFFARFPSAGIHNTYGPTEATVFTTHVRLTPEIVAKYPSLPVGRVKPGTEISLPEGEITITGANVAEGYLGRPELTLKNFSGESGAKSYRTGDLGHFLDGFLFFNGRIDNQVKMHGFRIELGEIDAKIQEFAGVEASVTLPLKRGGEVKKLASFIQASQAIDLDALRAHLSRHLPEYMIPGVLRLVENYPLNTNGKIDAEALLRHI